jgi:hypothetical protein
MATFTDPFAILNKGIARRQRRTDKAGYRAQLGSLSDAYTKSSKDISDRYRQGMGRQVTGFTGRGLGNSGLFQRAMQEYATAQQKEIGGAAETYNSGLNAAGIADQRSAQQLRDFLDAERIKKLGNITTAASELRQWQPYTGLYS